MAERIDARGGLKRTITPSLALFLQQRDSFYFGTSNAQGQPYIQHRGGPKGFLRILGESKLGFADVKGNEQYITLGNLAENSRAFLFLMDYELRQRIKIWGRARVIEDDEALLSQLKAPDPAAKAMRAIVFDIEAWDANCAQHIKPRYDEEATGRLVQPLLDRIADLEAALARLRSPS